MSAIDNVKIRQSWIDDEILKVERETGHDPDTAFLHLASSLILECQAGDIDPADIVDGGFDKQIDLINVADDHDRGAATISIIQAKNHVGFESNIAIQMRNGLDWIFEQPRSEVEKLQNTRFKNKILEIRELRSDYGSSNLAVFVYHVTKGDSAKPSDEYIGEAKVLSDKYSNAGFGQFKFCPFGANELTEIIDEGDRHKRQVDLEVPILYDANSPSVIRFGQGDTNSLICTVAGKDLAVAASVEPRDALFDLNVRPFYGNRGKVNKDILATCTGDDAARFWFLNNGVTMVCDKFDLVADPDASKVKVTNAQIVNGCQTTVTLREAFEKGDLSADVKVLLRLYSTDNPNLVDKITLTTNNQNRITDRDLRANDPVQRDIERIMLEKFGYYYERKNRQHRALRGENKKKVIPSPKAAQAYLAVVRGKPSNARGYLAAVWSDFYGEIFQNASVPDLVLAYKILSFCQTEARNSKLEKLDDVELETRVYGSSHVARAVGFELLKDNWGNSNTLAIENLLTNSELEAKMQLAYTKSVKICIDIRNLHRSEDPIPALYYKNSKSQKALNAQLHS
jgi:hypothetical protein